MYMYILTHEYLMHKNKEQCRCWDDMLIYSYKNIINVIYFSENNRQQVPLQAPAEPQPQPRQDTNVSIC